MSKEFYRFRRVDNLIGDFQELEKQSIFFAAPDSLNDPMEGFSDIYWKGDRIAWESLFKNYLYTLENLYSLYCVRGESYDLTANDIRPGLNIDDLPTQKYKDLLVSIVHVFMDSSVDLLIDGILTRSTPIKRDELLFYLSLIHLKAFQDITQIYVEHKLMPATNTMSEYKPFDIETLVKEGFFTNLESFIVEHGNEASEVIYFIQRTAQEQMSLLTAYNEDVVSKRNLFFILNNFNSDYIIKLEQLCVPSWYTSCFMTECKNSSIWGSYGDNHKGVCLIFKAEKKADDDYLSLNGINSSSMSKGDTSPTYHHNFMNFKFHPIDYQSNFIGFNFFTNISQLNMNTLSRMWFANDKGERSICAQEMLDNEEHWREKYWDNFIRRSTLKSKDWAYENEHRLIWHSNLFDLSSTERRTLTYKFESLSGVIFGIKTSFDNKIKIMKIIERKCRANNITDFKFFQAYYSFKDNCIDHYQLNLLKFEQ